MPLGNAMSPTDGVLLIGHGTSDPVGTKQFFELGQLLASRLAPIPVQPCLLELQSPTIRDGWAKLIDRGCQRVLASPLLLFSAGHAKRDIPDALRACAIENSNPFVVAKPLSRAPELVELLLLRVQQAIARNSIDLRGARQAVVLVGRGSYDPCAQADLKLLCGLLQHRLDVDVVRPAYYAMAKPGTSEVFADLAALGRFDSVVVQPHLLFDGLIYRNLVDQVRTAQLRYPDMQWTIGDYLGPDPLVASAIERRLHQLLVGDLSRVGGWIGGGSS